MLFCSPEIPGNQDLEATPVGTMACVSPGPRSTSLRKERRGVNAGSVVFAIYADSFLFVLATGILQFGFGVGYSGEVCESAILLCLVCYVTTKVPLSPMLLDHRHIANMDGIDCPYSPRVQVEPHQD